MRRNRNPSSLTYEDLYRFFKRELGCREGKYLDGKLRKLTVVVTNCGFDLRKPPLYTESYWCTPENSVKFAETGGEGCHFSFMTSNGDWSTQSPVVLTVPTAAPCCNVIVGENLYEFLCLGIRTGFIELERLPRYAPRFGGRRLSSEMYIDSDSVAPWVKPKMASELGKLANRFALKPWQNPGERLLTLQRKYLKKLTYSKRYYATLSGDLESLLDSL